MKYDVLLFDADDTLFDFKKTMRLSLQESMEFLGLTFRPEYCTIYETLNNSLWKQLELGKLTKEELKKRRMAEFFEMIGVQADPVKMQEKYQQCLDNGGHLIPGAKETLDALSGQADCYLVTNGFAQTQRGRLKKAGIDGYFKALFISEEIGYQKPRKEFFDAVFSVLGGEARERTLIIGDSLTSDILGGNNAGIATCWYNPHHKENTQDVSVTMEIRSLSELPEKLFSERW
ncbi:MAG: YjjG family noncanonical pyrimidine nucleotidase [Lachnospiraceae bacterium]|nr:YjjG family noncanonical pyrimidine nucleotidase [Lachnospiraceae bacterium]